MTPDELRTFSVILSECIQAVYAGAKELLREQTFAFIEAVELGKNLDVKPTTQDPPPGNTVQAVSGDKSLERVDPEPIPQKPVVSKKRGRPKKQK